MVLLMKQIQFACIRCFVFIVYCFVIAHVGSRFLAIVLMVFVAQLMVVVEVPHVVEWQTLGCNSQEGMLLVLHSL